jgi:hypothetical protein
VIDHPETVEEAEAFIRVDPFHGGGVWQGPVIAQFKGSIFDPEKFA